MRKAKKPAAKSVRKQAKPSPPIDAALLRRARRLSVRAAAVKTTDRAQILALIDDIQTVRTMLRAECARLDQEMNRANVRITAMRAYAHGAMVIRARRH